MESARLSTLSKEALALHARVSGAREKIPSVCLKIGQMWRKAPCFGLPLRCAVINKCPTIFRSIFLYMVESTQIDLVVGGDYGPIQSILLGLHSYKYRNYDFQNYFLVLLVIGWIELQEALYQLNPDGTDGKPTSFLCQPWHSQQGYIKVAKILKYSNTVLDS